MPRIITLLAIDMDQIESIMVEKHKTAFFGLKSGLGQNFFFLGVEKHVNAHCFNFGQNFLAQFCFKICGGANM